MQMNNTVTQATVVTNLIDNIQRQKVAIVVNIIISAVTATSCSLMIYNENKCKHQMKFTLKQNQTIFVQSKLFLTQGNSLRVKSQNEDTTFTAMYDVSINS